MPKNLVIDLSGKAGLVNYHAGDTDMVTPRPDLRIKGESDGMASGLFNPYLRDGYMAPTTSTTTTVTLSVSANEQLSSVKFDQVGGEVYYADLSNFVYKGDTAVATTLTKIIELDSDASINDIEIYDKNSTRNLYTIYTKETQSLGSNLSTVADWLEFGVVVRPSGTSKVTMIASDEDYLSVSSMTRTVDVPSDSNMALIVFVAVQTATVTGVTYDGGAMTLVSSKTRNVAGTYWNIYTYQLGSIASGSKNIVVTNSGAAFTMMNAVVFNNAHATPVVDYSYSWGHDSSPSNSLPYTANSAVARFIWALNTQYDVTTLTGSTSYNPTGTTGAFGSTVTMSNDGTKMYVDGHSIVYQYTLSTPFSPTTATYDTVSYNYGGKYSGVLNGLKFSSNGSKMYILGQSSQAIHGYTLSTPWNVSTATFDSTYTVTHQGLISMTDFYVSADGTNLYTINWFSAATSDVLLYQYTLSTPYDVSTAVYSGNSYDLPYQSYSMDVTDDESVIFLRTVNTQTFYTYSFDATDRTNISKINVLGAPTSLGNNIWGFCFARRGGRIVGRSSSNNQVYTYTTASGSDPSILSVTKPILEKDTTIASVETVIERPAKLIDMSTSSLPVKTEIVENWLTDVQEVFINSPATYNFIRLADNGFAYVFTNNRVHKIDGGITGGSDGTFIKDVLIFPEYFTITDAIDYRSRIYMGISQYPVNSLSTTTKNFVGSCGIIIWNRQSTQLNGTEYIELPRVREIKRIYASPEGVLKVITIADNGLTEIRRFGYNDSGGVVFPVVNTLSIGAFPQLPDSLSTAGKRVMWIGNDGKVYCDQDGSVTQIFQVKAQGTSTAGLLNNITGGVLFYGSDTETAGTGFRSNKQAVTISYYDSGVNVKKFYPFDLTNGSDGAQAQVTGDVFTTVQVLPVTSTARRLRIYNAPVSGTGTDTVATIKLYYNQSTTVGQTKTITKDEAKRGYVDLALNKPYIHAVQIEIEWPTAINLGSDTYLPSIAIITYDETTTSSPDNG